MNNQQIKLLRYQICQDVTSYFWTSGFTPLTSSFKTSMLSDTLTWSLWSWYQDLGELDSGNLKCSWFAFTFRIGCTPLNSEQMDRSCYSHNTVFVTRNCTHCSAAQCVAAWCINTVSMHEEETSGLEYHRIETSEWRFFFIKCVLQKVKKNIPTK